jgi:hypothetical protein
MGVLAFFSGLKDPNVTRFHRHLLVMLLVPLMLARGLLPSGFMVDTSTGHAQLVMCPADGPLPMTAGHDHHHHHHHHGSGSSSTGHDAGTCPFAMAGGAALQPATVAFLSTPPELDRFLPAAAAPFERSHELGAHLIRGPPHLS